MWDGLPWRRQVEKDYISLDRPETLDFGLTSIDIADIAKSISADIAMLNVNVRQAMTSKLGSEGGWLSAQLMTEWRSPTTPSRIFADDTRKCGPLLLVLQSSQEHVSLTHCLCQPR